MGYEVKARPPKEFGHGFGLEVEKGDGGRWWWYLSRPSNAPGHCWPYGHGGGCHTKRAAIMAAGAVVDSWRMAWRKVGPERWEKLSLDGSIMVWVEVFGGGMFEYGASSLGVSRAFGMCEVFATAKAQSENLAKWGFPS